MPYFIDRIEDASGQVVWQAKPPVCACEACERPVDLGDLGAHGQSPQDNRRTRIRCAVAGGPLPPEQIAPRVISPQNAYLMTDMMADVIKRGTGRRALGR